MADVGWTLELSMLWLPDITPSATAREAALIEAEAKGIRDPWNALYADADSVLTAALRDLRSVLIAHADEVAGLPARGGNRPAGVTKRSRWHVRDFLAVRKRHVLAGVHGSAKTTLWVSMLAASIKRETFLERDTVPLRWLVLSGEQTAEEMEELFRAHGLTDEHLQNVHWTTREAGVALGEPRSNEWLTREVDAFKPDVIVLDTVGMVCSDVAIRQNDDVRRLYREVLTPLVDRHGASLLALTHMRKGGGRGDEGIIGAVDWTNQADQVMTVAPTGALNITKNDDGTMTTQRPFALKRHKGRVISDSSPEHYEVHGHVDAFGATDELRMQHPVVEVPVLERLLAGLDAPLGRGALAKALDLDPTGSRFRKALDEALDSSLVVKADGLYERSGV